MSTIAHPELSIATTRSTSDTNTHDLEAPSRTGTAVDLQEQRDVQQNRWVAAEEAPMRPLAEYVAREGGDRGAEVKLSQSRKWFLLFIFSVAQVCHFHPLPVKKVQATRAEGR